MVALTPGVVAVVCGAALLTGISKGGLGGGLGPVITVLVAVVVPVDVAIGLLLPLLMVGDVSALVAHWGRWDAALLLRLLPGAVLGVAATSLFLRGISADGLRITVAVVTLATVAYKLVEPHLRGRQVTVRPWHGAVAGAVSGVTSTVAHVGGPPVVVYLVLARAPAVPYVATLAAFFWAVNWLKVPGYAVAGLFDWSLLWRLAPVGVLVPVGTAVGRWAVHRVDQRTFDRAVLATLVVGAVLLLAG